MHHSIRADVPRVQPGGPARVPDFSHRPHASCLPKHPHHREHPVPKRGTLSASRPYQLASSRACQSDAVQTSQRGSRSARSVWPSPCHDMCRHATPKLTSRLASRLHKQKDMASSPGVIPGPPPAAFIYCKHMDRCHRRAICFSHLGQTDTPLSHLPGKRNPKRISQPSP